MAESNRAPKLLNMVMAFLIRRLGLSPMGAEILEVKGRTSGKTYSAPVNPLNYDGTTWLISARGETAWAKNMRVVKHGALVKGTQRRELRFEDVPVDERVDALRAYLERWDSQVKSFMGVDRNASEAELREVASRTPVFREVRGSRGFN